jgi:ATP adenylyltransferase
LNAYPYTNGHLMVAPFRHTGSLEDLSDAELLQINQLVRDCVRWLTLAYGPQGFNIGVNMGRSAGAGIEDHLHWHIVPRWNGDTNFMTTVGETRVLAQSLEDTYDRLLGVTGGE